MDKTIIGKVTTQHNVVEKLTPHLRIKSPNNTIQRFQLSKSKITIGRGDSCHIVIDDKMASREHCQIWLDEKNNINVLDLKSTNGSKIDGTDIQHAILQANHRLKVGQHTLKIEYKDAEEIHHEELLQAAATCDPLTGISNRKWFEERVNQIIQAIADKNQYIAIVMLDIDHFKQVNDNYGHQMGDVVIKEIAEILNDGKRHQDLLARYGGEEFILCLPDSTENDTKLFCERVRNKIADTTFRFGKEQLNVTVSLGGFSDIIEQDSNLSDMTSYADKALYQSKKSGRNQTTISNNTFK